MQMKLLDIKWLIFLEKVLTLMAMTLVQRKSTHSNYIIIYLLVASGIQCNSTTMNSRGTSPRNYLISVYICSCFKAASLPTAVSGGYT